MKSQFEEDNQLNEEEPNPSNPLLEDRMQTVCSPMCQDMVEVPVLLGGCVTQEEMQNAPPQCPQVGWSHTSLNRRAAGWTTYPEEDTPM